MIQYVNFFYIINNRISSNILCFRSVTILNIAQQKQEVLWQSIHKMRKSWRIANETTHASQSSSRDLQQQSLLSYFKPFSATDCWYANQGLY